MVEDSTVMDFDVTLPPNSLPATRSSASPPADPSPVASAPQSPERDRPGGAPVGGLAALLRASARDCPEAVLFLDDEGATTARAAAEQVAGLAEAFRQCGLRPGERIILVTGATTRSLLALVAALQAGLEPALVACGLGPLEIAARVAAADAVALVGPTHYGALALGDGFLSAAALSETIRLVGTLGPSSMDGAADLTAAVVVPVTVGGAASPETPVILTFEDAPGAPVPVVQRQTALLSGAHTKDSGSRSKLADCSTMFDPSAAMVYRLPTR